MNLIGTKLFYLLATIIILSSCKPETQNSIKLSTAIIPLPKSILIKQTSCVFSSLKVYSPKELNEEVSIFKNQLNSFYKNKKELFSENGMPIQLSLSNDSNIINDYDLIIKNNRIEISANKSSGIFHGLQSLFQLITLNNQEQKFKLPCLIINDKSAFEHRGFLLDCCRHFFDVTTIKKYIDLLSLYKMNVFHWHLTEDQGWRIEINKYPLLNSIGSWREDSSGTYGGYYSKKEIKDIVEYAKKRHIKVIPEIELPGHSQAVISAYPHLSCNQQPVEVATDWGVFKEIYCAGNDSVFIFIEDILDEVTAIFPSKLIHIGGDEAPKFRWEHCSKCQKRMKEENLDNEHELQSYFIERVARILSKKKRTIIGWDEILEGEITTPAIIQSWRGFKGGIKAAKQGKKVIMSPTSNAYFDYKISTTDLEKVYNFNPIPSELDSTEQKLIIGGECNLWSERIPNVDELDNKAFPRLLAMSEVLWRNPKKKNYSSFQNRVQEQYSILDRMSVKYGIEAEPVVINTKKINNYYTAQISSKVKGLNFKYKINNNEFVPSSKSNTISITNSGELTVQAFKGGKPYGDEKKQKISIHLANYKKTKYNSEYSDFYKANGDKTLADGLLGSLDFADGKWQGFWGEDLNYIVDMDTMTEINKIDVNFYQYSNSWILIPKKIAIFSSNDGKKWKELREMNNLDNSKKRGKFIKKISFDNLNFESRFIKIKAENYGELPSWHEAAGSESWLFVDEVIIL